MTTGIPGRRFHRAVLFRLLLAWMALAGGSFSGSKAMAALQFDVFLGYEGFVHEAGWFPISFEVFNDGAAFSGVIEVSSGTFNEAAVATIPVELPTNTRKRISVPLFAGGGKWSSQYSARLIDKSGRVRSERENIPLRSVVWESVLIGAIPRSFSGVPVFPDVKSRQEGQRPVASRMQPESFPDNPISLEGLNAFYLDSERAVSLSVPQVTALLAWVRGGGHLIVAVEQPADVASVSWLQQFIPTDLGDMTDQPVGATLGAWLTTSGGASEAGMYTPRSAKSVLEDQSSSVYGRLTNDAAFASARMPVTKLSGRDGATLIPGLAVTAHRGRGQVTVLGFSPEREPFRSWKLRPYFWSKLVGVPEKFISTSDINSYGGWSLDGVFGALIDSRQVRKLPIFWLMSLLLVYLVVIGPFDRWFLKKINRQMLTWITFPSYVVIFSVLIYFLGYRLRAGDTEWNELQVVDILPRGDRADLRGRSFISVYSSVNADYPLEAEPVHSAFRAEMVDVFGNGRENTKSAVEFSGNSYKAKIAVPVWSSLLYVSDWFKDSPRPFNAQITETQEGFQVKLENLQDQPLTNLRLAVGELLYQIPDLAPRESKEVVLQRKNATRLDSWVHTNFASFRNAAQQRRQQFGDDRAGRLEDRAQVATAASLSGLFPENDGNQRGVISLIGMDLSPLVTRGDAVLFAFENGRTPTRPLNQFQPPRLRRDTLWRLALTVKR